MPGKVYPVEQGKGEVVGEYDPWGAPGVQPTRIVGDQELRVRQSFSSGFHSGSGAGTDFRGFSPAQLQTMTGAVDGLVGMFQGMAAKRRFKAQLEAINADVPPEPKESFYRETF